MQLAAILHLCPALREKAAPSLQKSPGLRPLLDGLQAAEQVWSLHAQREGAAAPKACAVCCWRIIRDLRVVLILLSGNWCACARPPTRRRPNRRRWRS